MEQKGLGGMVRRATIKIANQAARRFRLLWNLVGYGLATYFMIVGAGYVVAGDSAVASKTLQLLINVEGGSYGLGHDAYRVHGAILMLIAIVMFRTLGFDYTKWTRFTLIAFTFYSVLVAVMIFAGWTLYPISFAAPWIYLLLAFLSGSLLILAPPLNDDGSMYVGVTQGNDGSKSA